MKVRNKELKEHIKDTPKAGKHDRPSKSRKRQEQKNKLETIKYLYNNYGYLAEAGEI